MEMRLIVYAVFAVVYLGLIAGRMPRLAVDRTGIVLLGAIALVVSGAADPGSGDLGIDVSTILLLFSFMVISAQLRLGGFYSRVSARIAGLDMTEDRFLAVLIATTGLLSALLSNDIVCLAMTPVLIRGCVKKGRNPVPYLLALACAANIGSAATLVGNPQVMLIGQTLSLDFMGYTMVAAVPVALSLAALWLILREKLGGEAQALSSQVFEEERSFNLWQTQKGLVVLSLVVAAFLFTSWPRDIVALAGAAALLTSRTMASRKTLGLVDWQLLVLFMGLFVINRSFAAAGGMDSVSALLARTGVALERPAWLFAACAVLSNLVSNVPAVMLLLSLNPDPAAGHLLALVSTFAGNFLIVGSIANIIVIDQASILGVRISWREHARIGVPVTLASLVITGLWIAVIPL